MSIAHEFGEGRERNPEEKGWEAEEERARTTRDSQGDGKREKTSKIAQHFVIFRNSYGTKRWEPLQKGVVSERKRTKGGGVTPPPPPPCAEFRILNNLVERISFGSTFNSYTFYFILFFM